jgi:hypothetical protein
MIRPLAALFGGAEVATARDHLDQSIWFYDRDLPRAP